MYDLADCSYKNNACCDGNKNNCYILLPITVITENTLNTSD